MLYFIEVCIDMVNLYITCVVLSFVFEEPNERVFAITPRLPDCILCSCVYVYHPRNSISLIVDHSAGSLSYNKDIILPVKIELDMIVFRFNSDALWDNKFRCSPA